MTRQGRFALPAQMEAAAMDEAEFQRRVIRRAREVGWLTIHVRRSMPDRHSDRYITPTDPPGFFDLVLVRERVMFVELKTNKSYPSPQQRMIHERFRSAGAEVHVWRPRDWSSLCEVLGR